MCLRFCATHSLRLKLNEHLNVSPLGRKGKSRVLEQAQSQLYTALRAWDISVTELWRTSIALTQAQKRLEQIAP
jgi:hypothetical protein